MIIVLSVSKEFYMKIGLRDLWHRITIIPIGWTDNIITIFQLKVESLAKFTTLTIWAAAFRRGQKFGVSSQEQVTRWFWSWKVPLLASWLSSKIVGLNVLRRLNRISSSLSNRYSQKAQSGKTIILLLLRFSFFKVLLNGLPRVNSVVMKRIWLLSSRRFSTCPGWKSRRVRELKLKSRTFFVQNQSKKNVQKDWNYTRCT